MAADLRSNTLFGRFSFVLMDQSLIKLEHASTRDRLRKFRFVEIEAVTFSRVVPVVRMIICAVIFILPGVGVLFFQEIGTTILGLSLIALGVGLIYWYLRAGRTIIQIYRANKGVPEKITGIFRPRRLSLFRANLIAGIHSAQSEASIPDAEPPPAPDSSSLPTTETPPTE